jgi:hypothetical protein
MNPLFAAARELLDFLDSFHFSSCLIGGLTVERWGEPRLTVMWVPPRWPTMAAKRASWTRC